jgi:hypothetical protein
MNREELRAVLDAKRIRPRSYGLDGGSPEDCYCIDRSSGAWAVYYSERGKRNDERWFATEDEDQLLKWLLEDPTTRERDRPPPHLRTP